MHLYALAPLTLLLSGARTAELFAQTGYRQLPVTWGHAAKIDNLPSIHNDPFDRILIAQSLTEPMQLLSRNTIVVSYGAMVTPV